MVSLRVNLEGRADRVKAKSSDLAPSRRIPKKENEPLGRGFSTSGFQNTAGCNVNIKELTE
jgi:hypothetical protein